MAVNAVALQLPTFWTAQPEVWFAQTEAQFNLKNITTDATKYFYVVAALDQEAAGRLLGTLRTPPEANKYDTLKQQLLKAYGLTRRDRAAKLLDMAGLGDRKPSVLLAEMRSLSDGHTDCMLFEEIFLRQMPTDIRLQLAQQDFTDLDLVGERADALWLAKNQSQGADISVIQSPHSIASRQHAIPQPTYIIPARINKSNTTQCLCYYHARFGGRARRCKAPCSWSGNAMASRQ